MFGGGVCLSLTLQNLSCKTRFGRDDAFALCMQCVTGIKHNCTEVRARLLTASRVGSLHLAD